MKEGAWVDFRRGDETTPLMCYSESGNVDLVLELLGFNANVDLQDKVSPITISLQEWHIYTCEMQECIIVPFCVFCLHC